MAVKRRARGKKWRAGYEAGYAEAWRAALGWGLVRIVPAESLERDPRPRKNRRAQE